jgi:chromosome segregation ATPase
MKNMKFLRAKKKPTNNTASDEDDESVKDMLKTISLQLNTMNGKMDSRESEVNGLRVLFEDLKQENS